MNTERIVKNIEKAGFESAKKDEGTYNQYAYVLGWMEQTLKGLLDAIERNTIKSHITIHFTPYDHD